VHAIGVEARVRTNGENARLVRLCGLCCQDGGGRAERLLVEKQMHVGSFFPPNDFQLELTGYGAQARLWRTICQSYSPQPDYWTFRSQLQGPHRALLATDTFPEGGEFTMPATLCCWYGLAKAATLDRQQTQASRMRACRRPPSRTAARRRQPTDTSSPAPSWNLGRPKTRK
jgi:hypothetical protein